MTITFDVIQTAGIAALVYMLGVLIKNRVSFLRTYFIPAPVIGGLIVSLLIFLGLKRVGSPSNSRSFCKTSS